MLQSLCVCVLMVGSVAAAELDVGDEAPPFTVRGSEGVEYSSELFLGKQPVVIAWYPKAFTGG